MRMREKMTHLVVQESKQHDMVGVGGMHPAEARQRLKVQQRHNGAHA